jgi:glycosyltransferase involved in cell wall biosynthesis
MINKPLVSIGVPIFNEEKNIAKCLKNILKQSYKNIEVVISDNNSTDETLKICQAFKKKNKKIKIFRSRKNLGQGWNFYQVLTKSKGEFFMFQAADDLRSSNFIKENLDYLIKNKNYLGSSGMAVFGSKNKKFRYSFSFNQSSYENIVNFFKIKWQSHSIIYGLFVKNKIIKFLDLFKSDNYFAKDWLINLLIVNSGYFNLNSKTKTKFGQGLSVKKNAIQLQRSRYFFLYLLEVFFPLAQFFFDFIKFRSQFSYKSKILILKELIKLSLIIHFINIKNTLF